MKPASFFATTFVTFGIYYCRRLLLIYLNIAGIVIVAMGPMPTSEHSYTSNVQCSSVTFIWYLQNKCVHWYSGIKKLSIQSHQNANEWYFIVQNYLEQLTLYCPLVTLGFTKFNIKKCHVLPTKFIAVFCLVLSTDRNISQIHN